MSSSNANKLEHRIVDPKVGGSRPLTHPTSSPPPEGGVGLTYRDGEEAGKFSLDSLGFELGVNVGLPEEHAACVEARKYAPLDSSCD